MNTLASNTRLWFCTRYLAFKDTAYLVFFGADMVTIRVILALASLVSGVALLVDDDKFQMPSYAVVGKFGNEKMWAVYFFLHFIGVHWRVFERSKSRPTWALIINTWGFAIWFISTVGVAWAVGSVGIPTSIALTMCVASAWALFRTGLGRDVVTL